MIKEPVHLSDWIQYLISIRNLAIAFCGIIFTIAVSLIITSLTYAKTLTPELQNGITIITWLFIFMAVWLIFPVSKSTKLLKKIMKEKQEVDVDKIRKIVFNEGEKMGRFDYASWKDRFIWLTLIFEVLAFLFLVIGIWYDNNNYIDAFKFLLPVGIAFLSLSFACNSIVIADESDKKMKSIANVEFLKVVNMVEDARIYFNAKIYPTKTYTWKTRNNIEMAIELIKRDKENNYIEPEYMEKLWYYFKMSFNHFFHDANWRNEKDSMNHLAESYAMLEEYYDSKHITEFNTYVNEDFKNKKDKKIKNEFLALIQAAKTRLSV
ncbi:MAG: hypothetical protein IMZ52_08655 [Actinobacteria bacterium]|nr:hypothetical protein [Actinomycetota bacterium]MBE3121486.1 hypothetical protein [Thermoplasmata archaeon]